MMYILKGELRAQDFNFASVWMTWLEEGGKKWSPKGKSVKRVYAAFS